jgi:hypothetical protein
MLDHTDGLGLRQAITVRTDSERQLYDTYLASMFRILRFGQTEAHGRGMTLLINFFIDHGALRTTSGSKFESLRSTIPASRLVCVTSITNCSP